MSDARESRKLGIAKLDGQVRRIDEHTYIIKSQSGNGEYHITASEIGWNCSCPDFVSRGQKCGGLSSQDNLVYLYLAETYKELVMSRRYTAYLMSLEGDKTQNLSIHMLMILSLKIKKYNKVV